MKLLTKVLGRFARSSVKKVAVTTAVFLSLTGASVAGVSAISSTTVDASGVSACGDNSSNSIIRNGASSRAALISKIKASPELKQIYADRGLTAKDYSRFVSDAKPGVATRNNTIVVSGDVVATNAGSLGRTKSCQGSGAKTYDVKGFKPVYGNLNSQSMQASSLPVDVLFNDKGQVQFAVMTTDCANPTTQTPVKPTYECKTLQSKSLGDNQFSFTTDANAGHGAKITKLVYDFGDGSDTKTTTNPDTAVKHTFTKDATVKVTVYVSLPGGGTVKLTNCEKKVTFTPPKAVYACDLLKATPGKVDKDGNTSYTLTAKAHATNATITSYTFHFDDNSTGTKTFQVNDKNQFSVDHVYAPGTYQARVHVTVKTNTGKVDTVSSDDCTTPITVKPLASNLVCNDLTANKGVVNATTGATSYSFTAKATPTNATISSYVFNFGDSTTQTKNTSATTTTSDSHTYAAGKTYLVKVAVTGKDVYGKTKTASATADCQVSITVPMPKTPGVTITKHVDNVKTEQVAVGQIFTYELVVTNSGAVDLTNAVVTDTPPAGVTLLTADKGTVSAVGDAWAYTIPSLKVGASVSINLTAKVPAQVDGSLVNTACVNAVEVNPSQPTKPDACDTATVTVPPVVPKNPNITITKTVDGQKSEQVAVGQNFTYQLVIKNTGEKDLINAVVTDTAPAGVTLLSADLGSVTSDTAWTYTIPTLAVGDSVTVNITATVKAYVADSLVNTACVNAVEVNPEQPTQPDACDTATVTVTPPVVTPPTTLVNTGAGSVVGIFAATAALGAIAHRLFLGRRLNRQN